jgi:hypothetical protein
MFSKIESLVNLMPLLRQEPENLSLEGAECLEQAQASYDVII